MISSPLPLCCGDYLQVLCALMCLWNAQAENHYPYSVNNIKTAELIFETCCEWEHLSSREDMFIIHQRKSTHTHTHTHNTTHPNTTTTHTHQIGCMRRSCVE